MKLANMLTPFKTMTRNVLKRNDDLYCMVNISGFMELWFSRSIATRRCNSRDITIFFHYDGGKVIL